MEGEKKKHTEEAGTEAVGEARQIEEPRAPLASIAQAAMTAFLLLDASERRRIDAAKHSHENTKRKRQRKRAS